MKTEGAFQDSGIKTGNALDSRYLDEKSFDYNGTIQPVYPFSQA
jgi:hypothetical protein